MTPGLQTIIPVILSGGTGTRLWPVSREAHPKPFMLMPDGQSLLQKTYLRAQQTSGADRSITVTNRDYFFSSRDTLKQSVSDTSACVFLLEKNGRNTAAAITMAALHAAEHMGGPSLLLVLPSDHLVAQVEAFAEAVQQAAVLATRKRLVTFGIQPSRPETGFGYIQTGEPLHPGYTVSRFVEKPDLATATAYVQSGEYLWNAGMFCFEVDTFLHEMGLHAPEVLSACQACYAAMRGQTGGSGQGLEIPDALYAQVPSISIDHALMEKSGQVAVIPADIGWSDIGSWTAVRDLTPGDANNNRSNEDSIFIDSQNTYIHADQRLVATVGTRNLIIVDTPDALLVSDADSVQDVRQVVSLLKQKQHPAHQLHQTVARPWGTYTVLGEGARYKLKRIEVLPGASLSLQMHHHRNEHWIVVSGVAEVTNGENVFRLASNESTYIPAEHKHRLHNPGPDPLVMIEVQSGSYLGEDDIVRFEDIYGRTN